MNMNHWVKRLVLLAIIVPATICYGQTSTYQANVHYEILPEAVRTTNPDKIEVNEVFSYTCNHCFDFESVLHPWVAQLGDDVDFQRTPAIWHPSVEVYAKAYYSAVYLDVLDKIHMPLFDAIHVRKKPIKSAQDIADFFSSQGVDKESFSKVYHSFGIASMINQAKARIRSYRTQGTPEIIINGKYRVSTRKAGGFQGMLNVASFLIDKERRAKVDSM
jgi:thiol:disulfide interchange protein DsbA